MSATLPAPAPNRKIPDRAQLAALGPHSPRGPLVGHHELRSAFESFGIAADEVAELGTGGEAGHRFHVVGPEELLVGRRFEAL
ncbi:MAG: hypothetical protein AAGG01_19920, partial [Planctomycetota bacterium]